MENGKGDKCFNDRYGVIKVFYGRGGFLGEGRNGYVDGEGRG